MLIERDSMKKWKQCFLTIFVASWISAMLVVCVSCSAANGVCRDAKWLSEKGIDITQPLVDRQHDSGIAHMLKEQNRLMRRGDKTRGYLASK